MSTLFSSEGLGQDISSSASSSYFSGENLSAPQGEPIAPQSPYDYAAVRGRDGALNHSNASNDGNTSPNSHRGPAGVSRKGVASPVTRHVDVENGFSVKPLLGGPVKIGTGAAGATTKAQPVNHQPPPQQSFAQTSPTARAFAEQLSDKYLRCAYCSKYTAEPVQVMQEPAVMHLACAPCAASKKSANGHAVVPLPTALAACIAEMYRKGEVVVPAGAAAASSTSPAAATATAADAEAIAQRRTVRVVRDKAPSSTAPLGGNTPLSSTSVKTPAVAPAASVSPASAQKVIDELIAAEENERFQIKETSRESLASVHRHFITDLKVQNSRQLKTQGDRKYEECEYTAAVELYTKAIKMQPIDKMTKPNFLYGNRSAAHFMAQRYRECTDDCLEVVKLEPHNVKMFTRAAHSASFMGDLAWSVKILEMLPAESVTPTVQSEMAKYKSGLDLWRKAEAAFGTADSDESYRMLAAQFPQTTAFRQRYAESLLSQRHYLRAIEVLEVLSSSARTPQVCKIMAECMYMSGFEHFDRAFRVLREASAFDKDCDDLFRKMELVDDGKQKGNNNFANKKFAEAVDHYTRAIQHATGNDQILRILYCNRAAANKELGKYREGVEDCTKAIAIDPGFYKAYARRARCHQHLNDFFSAVKDFKKALENDRSDSDLVRELRNAEAQLAKEAEKEKDFYYQLGVSRSATEREIKTKYRELSLRWHPDKCVNMDEAERERAEHKFKVISEAYATLMDSTKRREYDLKFDREQRFQRGGGGLSSTYGGDYFRGHGNANARHRAGNGGFW